MEILHWWQIALGVAHLVGLIAAAVYSQILMKTRFSTIPIRTTERATHFHEFIHHQRLSQLQRNQIHGN